LQSLPQKHAKNWINISKQRSCHGSVFLSPTCVVLYLNELLSHLPLTHCLGLYSSSNPGQESDELKTGISISEGTHADKV
jgi:hypothetical protein